MEENDLNNHHNNNGNEETESKGAKRSLAERRGFNSNAAKINTTLFCSETSTNPSPSPATHLTIPPGISPTALLDSPIMLPNSQVWLYIYMYAFFHRYFRCCFSIKIPVSTPMIHKI